ncbi:hypothetical protein AB0I93_15770 [Streptomyces sp. NPDC049967]|uniref:hypothetical protein n=1 Tax=unclassified Streptomyces TaxID=2593676 RepID=UPI002E2C1210|nr:hypothetical protein [Streptomyces sp. NBC_00342]
MRGLVKRCDVVLASLSIPKPFNIPALVTAIEESRGRSIQLMPVDDYQGDLRTACGVRVRRNAVTYVLYRPRPTPHQTEHTILHLLAHEWMDHSTGLARDSESYELSEPLRQIIGTESGARQAVHARSRCESVEEREAELSAYLIKHRVQASTAGADLISRLEHSLSRPLGPQPRSALRDR